eukprot:g193.t1
MLATQAQTMCGVTLARFDGPTPLRAEDIDIGIIVKPLVVPKGRAVRGDDDKKLFDKAVRGYRDRMEVLEKVLGPDAVALGWCWMELAKLYEKRERTNAQAKGCYEQAAAVSTRSGAIEFQANVRTNYAAYLRERGEVEQALEECRIALTLRERTTGKSSLQYALTLSGLADTHYAKGDLDQALALFEQCATIEKMTISQDNILHAGTLGNIANILQDKGDLDRALGLYEEVAAITKKIRGQATPDYADTLNNMALVHQGKGNLDQALALFEESAGIRAAMVGKDSYDYAATINNMGEVLRLKGNIDQAAVCFEEALVIIGKTTGKLSSSYAAALGNLAGIHGTKGDGDRAIALLEECKNIQQATIGVDSPDHASTLYNLAQLVHAKGDIDRARALVSNAHRIWLKSYGANHPHTQRAAAAIQRDSVVPKIEFRADHFTDGVRSGAAGAGGGEDSSVAYALATAQSNEAQALFRKGDHKGALALFEECKGAYEKAAGKHSPGYSTTLNNIATVHHASGDLGQALAHFEESAAIKKVLLGEDSPGYAATLSNMAMVLQRQGDLGRAHSVISEAHSIFLKSHGAFHGHTQNAAAAMRAFAAFGGAGGGSRQGADNRGHGKFDEYGGIDPSIDPDLALAMRASLKEQAKQVVGS